MISESEFKDHKVGGSRNQFVGAEGNEDVGPQRGQKSIQWMCPLALTCFCRMWEQDHKVNVIGTQISNNCNCSKKEWAALKGSDLLISERIQAKPR